MNRMQNLSRRRFVLGSAALTGAGVVAAACGPLAPAGREGQKVTQQRVEIEFWHSFSPTHRFTLIDQAVIADFQVKNPNRVVNITAAGTGYTEKLKTAVVAGTPPNIIMSLQTNAVQDFHDGATVDVEGELKGNRQWGKLKGDLIPLLLETYRWKGKLSGMPVFGTYEGLGFNTELLKKAGLSLPQQGWTWDDYIAIGRRAASPPEVWLGFQQFGDMTYWHAANRGFPVNREVTRITVTSPENVEALEFKVAQVLTRRLETDTRAPAGAVAWFGQGKQLTEILNPGTLTEPRYPGIPLALMHHAHGPSNKKREILTSGNVYGYIVPKVRDGDKQRVAVEVALHGITPEQQVTNTRVSGEPAASQSALKSPAFIEAARTLAQKSKADTDAFKFLMDFFALAPHMVPRPSFPGWPEARRILSENMVKASKGEMAPREALREVEPRMQLILDEALRK